ncbi:MAG: hypothetical protein ACI8PB_003099 [Desulforhopalus sp.]
MERCLFNLTANTVKSGKKGGNGQLFVIDSVNHISTFMLILLWPQPSCLTFFMEGMSKIIWKHQ